MRKEFTKLGVILFICCIPYGIVGCMNQQETAPTIVEETLEIEPEREIMEMETVVEADEVEAAPELPRFTRADIQAPSYDEAPAYTQEDLDLLATVIYCEAGADYISDGTRQMVGEVVLNRVASEYFPNTIYEVLTAPYQYGRFCWTGVVMPDRASSEYEAHAVQRAYEIAESLLSNSVERLLPEDAIWQAEFSQGSEILAYQDGIYFCR